MIVAGQQIDRWGDLLDVLPDALLTVGVLGGLMAGAVGLMRWRKRRPHGKEHWYEFWREPDEKLWKRVLRWLIGH